MHLTHINGAIRSAMMAIALATVAHADPVTPNEATDPVGSARPDAVASWIGKTSTVDSGNFLPRRDSSRTSTAREASSTRVVSGVRSIDLLWPLIVVVALMVGGAIALRRWTPVTQRISARGGLQILGRHYLSGKQSLCLVRLGRRVVCIGVTPEHISTLAEINDPEEIAGLVAGVQAATPQSFSSIFTRMASQPAPTEMNDVADASAGKTSVRARAATEVQGLLTRVRNWSRTESSAEPMQANSVSTT